MRFSLKIPGPWLALLAVVPLAARGDDAAPWRMDAVYASRYVFRGVERAGDSVQAGAGFTRAGFRGGLWTSQPFDSGDPDELNLNAAYAWPEAGGARLEASVAQSWFSEVAGVEQGFEAGLTATLAPIRGLVPQFAYYHDFRLQSDTTQVSLAHSLALTQLGAFLEWNFYAGWVSGDDWRPDEAGPRQHDSYGYWGGEVSLPYRIGAHSTLVAGLHYAANSGRSATNGPFGSDSTDNLWVTLGVNLDF